MKITEELLELGKSSKGAWSFRQLRLLGVNVDKMEKGWKRRLIGKTIADKDAALFLSLKDAHLKKKEALKNATSSSNLMNSLFKSDITANRVFYTDGSANNLSPRGEGGWAYVEVKDDEIISQRSGSSLNTTNNRMEIYAILQVLKSTDKSEVVKICTDSQYAITCARKMRSMLKPNLPNLDLVRELVAEMTGRTVILEWVRGHNGNEFNEKADELAEMKREEIRLAHNIPVYTCNNSPKIKGNKTYNKSFCSFHV